jgi:TonB family protein
MKNFEIFHNRENITPEESNQYSDFNSLLKNYHLHEKRRRTFWKRFLLYSVVLLLFGLIALITYPPPSINIEINEELANEPLALPSEPTDEIKHDSGIEEESKIEVILPGNSKPEPLSKETNSEEKNLIFEYSEARPIHGFPALYEYFEENLSYPEYIVKDQIEGMVVIKFIIDTLGKPTDIAVEVPIHDNLDSLAISIITNMPPWIPAKKNGKPVPSTYRIPLNFRIAGDQETN